jgi:hypothetical protein
MHKYVGFICLCSIIFSCTKEDVKPLPVTYFEMHVDAAYPTSNSDNWVVLHDKDGNLLAARAFEAGDHVVFDTTSKLPEKIGITLVKFSPNTVANLPDEIVFVSYLGEDSRAKWTLKGPPPGVDTGKSLGILSINIADPQLGSQFDTQISNRFRGNGVANAAPGYIAFGDMGVTSTVDDFFIFATDRNGKPLYKFIENATPGDTSLTFDAFSEFDHIVNASFDRSNFSLAIVKGYESDQTANSTNGYYIDYLLSGIYGASKSSYQIGYLNRFTKYRTFISADYVSYSISYEAFGGIPSEPIILQNNIKAIHTDRTFDNLTLTAADYDWSSTVWTCNQNFDGTYLNTTWYSRSTAEPFKNLKILPKFLTDKFQGFDTGKFKLLYTNLYSGSTFSGSVDREFKGGPARDSYVEITKVLY